MYVTGGGMRAGRVRKSGGTRAEGGVGENPGDLNSII